MSKENMRVHLFLSTNLYTYLSYFSVTVKYKPCESKYYILCHSDSSDVLGQSGSASVERFTTIQLSPNA